jgi:sugar phosphate permease
LSKIEPNSDSSNTERVSFFKAWLIPRVFLYSATLFCVKLAVNSMLLWMPLLLKEYKNYSVYQIANVSSFFDSGGIMGSFLMGYFSDKLYSKRSPVSFIAVLVASGIGFTLTYRLHLMSQITLSSIMFLFGFIISGLNNIISASCAADIGK